MDGLGDRERDREVAPYPSEAQLLDVLYEVLAQGLPSRGGADDVELTRADVEGFLHEHARARKPREELLRFLHEHGLPTEPGEVSADHELAMLARGLQRAQRTSSLPAPSLPGAAAGPSEASFDEIEDETTSPRITAPRADAQSSPTSGVRSLSAATWPASPSARAGARIALAVAVLGLAVALLLSHLRAEGLAERLSMAQAARKLALQREAPLRAELKRLRADLGASVQERARMTAELTQQLAAREQAQAAAAARYATETAALERAIGPRLRIARQQLVKVGVLPPF